MNPQLNFGVLKKKIKKTIVIINWLLGQEKKHQKIFMGK